MYYILVSACQEIENSITGCFWLEVAHEVAVKTSFRVVITSKSLTKAGGSTSQILIQMLLAEGFISLQEASQWGLLG